MKISKKIILFFVVLVSALLLNISVSNAATISVNNEETLINAVNNLDDSENIIELTENIVLTRPFEITGKTLTINGNGHTVSRLDTNWTPNGSNGTLITAGLTGTKLTINNIILKDAQKYGVQTYNGAYVILNGVTLSNNGFGGVLVNGGTLEIRGLTLGKNGTPNNNGIEIAKGSSVSDSNMSKLIMNGTISSSETENVIYLAENDQLDRFEIQNSDSTTNKVLIQGNKVVITDANNAIVYESNENPNITMTGTSYVPNTPPTEEDPNPPTPPSDTPTETPGETPDVPPVEEEPNENVPNETETTEKETLKDSKDPTPKTGVKDFLGTAMFILCISIIGIFLVAIL